jgi:hypothetical protein
MGFARALAASTRCETLGAASGAGTTVTSGSAGYGSLVTLGTSSFNYDGVFLTYLQTGSSTAARVTVTANTGSADEIIIQDLFLDSRTSTAGPRFGIYVPIAIPKGAVIKAQVYTRTASITGQVAITGFHGDSRMSRGFRGLVSLTSFSGLSTATGLTLSGTTQTGWSQIIASSPYRIAGLYAAVSTNGSTPSVGATIQFDIGWGASGSEKPFCTLIAGVLTADMFLANVGPIPCNFAAGTRFAWRATASQTDTATSGLVLNGLIA